MAGGREFFYGDDSDGKRQDVNLHDPILWGGRAADAKASSVSVLEAQGIKVDLVKPLLDPELLKQLRERRSKRRADEQKA